MDFFKYKIVLWKLKPCSVTLKEVVFSIGKFIFLASIYLLIILMKDS